MVGHGGQYCIAVHFPSNRDEQSQLSYIDTIRYQGFLVVSIRNFDSSKFKPSSTVYCDTILSLKWFWTT